MGYEEKCTVQTADQEADALALLEHDHIAVRRPISRKVMFRDITSMSASADALTVSTLTETFVLHLGANSAKWLDRIQNPKSILDKFGVKAGSTAAVIGVTDTEFMEQLRARISDINLGVSNEPVDWIFLQADEADAISLLPTLINPIQPDGAIWVIYSRSLAKAGFGEDFIRSEALKTALVDVKIARFSDDYGSVKLVIRKELRRK